MRSRPAADEISGANLTGLHDLSGFSLPPLVCLHGFLGRAADWSDLVARWPAPVLAIDLPGHGSATGLAHQRYTMTGASRWVLGAMDAAHVSAWDRRPALVGYSMGGRLALHLAAHCAERFSAVVLESASPGLRTVGEQAERRRLDRERAHEITHDLAGFLDRWYRMPLFATLSEEARQKLVADRQAHEPSEIARALVRMGTGAQAPLWDWLSRLQVPTHAIAGSLDAKFVELARAMVAESDGRIAAHTIAGAGHMVHAERPDAFADLLARVLR